MLRSPGVELPLLLEYGGDTFNQTDEIRLCDLKLVYDKVEDLNGIT